MYFQNTNHVNARIIGAGRRWLLFVTTPDGLRQAGAIFISPQAALAAMEAR